MEPRTWFDVAGFTEFLQTFVNAFEILFVADTGLCAQRLAAVLVIALLIILQPIHEDSGA